MTRGRPTEVVAVLDNEAAQALADPAHPKHRRLLAVLEAVAQRRARAAMSAKVVVSTAARLEAGLDRRAPAAAALGRLRVHDEPLTSERADRAVALRTAGGGAVADAATAQLAEEAAATATVTVYTADLTDLPALVAHLGTAGVRVERV